MNKLGLVACLLSLWNPLPTVHASWVPLGSPIFTCSLSSRRTRHGPLFARAKKNKYAKFSKADKLAKDPLEAMIDESEAKIKNLEFEKKRKRNQVVPTVDENETRERDKILFPDVRSIDPYDPATYGYTELGTILGPHGVLGQLKVAGVTDFPERLCNAGVRHLKYPNRRSPRSINLLSGKKVANEQYIITLEGIGDREGAAKLRGATLYARQEERPNAIEDDEYLVRELVGLEVFLDDDSLESDTNNEDDTDEDAASRRYVGKVAAIVLAEEMCAIPELGQDLLEITLPRGPGATPSADDELVLVPFVPQIVTGVDMEDGAVYIDPPIGLLDLTYVREEKLRIRGFLPPGRS